MTIDARDNRSVSRAKVKPQQSPGRSRRNGWLVVLAISAALFGGTIWLGKAVAPTTAEVATSAADPTGPLNPPHKETQADIMKSDPGEFNILQEQAKAELGAMLKDADSARYQNVVAVSPPAARGQVSFCGLVNAKNSYGGYAGYTRFFIAPGHGAWLRNSPGIKFNEVWRTFCRDDDIVGRAYAFN